MPNALRQVVVSALLMCVMATVGTEPAGASMKNPPAPAKATKVTVVRVMNNKQRKICRKANSVRRAVVKKYNKRKPGRDICRQGQRDGSAPSVHKLTRYYHTLQRILHPPPPPVVTQVVAPATSSTASTGSTASPPAPVSSAAGSGSVAGGTLSAIAQCESGGNPSAVDPTGTYRGKYQFDYQTWQSVGGTGDPAAAPESVQDALAQKLYSQRGSAPWPVCGR